MKHILILFTDQQRWDTICALGNPHIQTPNLDALVDDSVVFDHCITPSPVCVPARYSMFTGQYPARTGCNNNNTERNRESAGFYSQITESGYNSGCVGKMHYLWDPYGPIGFDKRWSQEELAAEGDDYMSYIREKYPWVFDYNGMRSEMYYVPQISQLPPYDHPTQWIGDRSVEFIQSHTPDRPMLLFSSFIHPHPPYAPPAPWQKLYREDPPEPHMPEDPDSFYDVIGERCSLERLQISRQDILRTKNYYYACVSFVDYQVGRIIQALKDKGMYEDTLILFASDHGDMMGDFNAIGKRTMVDASCRVPLIIKYPGQEPRKRKEPCSLVDIAPTILNYAGIDYDSAEFDGKDLFSEFNRDVVFSQHGCGVNGSYMVTDGQNKLIYLAKTGKYYFFDTVPEQRDTYDPENPEVLRLKEKLDAYRNSDCNPAHNSATYEKYTKTHPHYPGRMDHTYLHEEELKAIPLGYTIDLT